MTPREPYGCVNEEPELQALREPSGASRLFDTILPLPEDIEFAVHKDSVVKEVGPESPVEEVEDLHRNADPNTATHSIPFLVINQIDPLVRLRIVRKLRDPCKSGPT